jgi:hypothetical protein
MLLFFGVRVLFMSEEAAIVGLLVFFSMLIYLYRYVAYSTLSANFMILSIV